MCSVIRGEVMRVPLYFMHVKPINDLHGNKSLNFQTHWVPFLKIQSFAVHIGNTACLTVILMFVIPCYSICAIFSVKLMILKLESFLNLYISVIIPSKLIMENFTIAVSIKIFLRKYYFNQIFSTTFLVLFFLYPLI